MGELIGTGLTHFPAFPGGDDGMATALRHMPDSPVLAGAMAGLGCAPRWCELVQSHVFRSGKVLAVMGSGERR